MEQSHAGLCSIVHPSSPCPTHRRWALHIIVGPYASLSGLTHHRQALRFVVGPYTSLSGLTLHRQALRVVIVSYASSLSHTHCWSFLVQRIIIGLIVRVVGIVDHRFCHVVHGDGFAISCIHCGWVLHTNLGCCCLLSSSSVGLHCRRRCWSHCRHQTRTVVVVVGARWHCQMLWLYSITGWRWRGRRKRATTFIVAHFRAPAPGPPTSVCCQRAVPLS